MLAVFKYPGCRRFTFAGLLLGLFLWGCNTPEEKSVENQRSGGHSQVAYPEFPSIETSDVYAYVCGDSFRFTAYVTRDSSWLFLPDTALKLKPQRSASGARFASDSYFYWSKDDSALLQLPEQSLRSCRSESQERSWQAAKIRGVDFRALGQEPGWYLEITNGEQIKYVGNYGQDTVYTPVPDPQIDKRQGQTIYRAETKAHNLTLEISDSSCTDSMSGFEFPSTVSITVNGETYRGCGRSLR
jgi:putative lipoprotein